MIITRTKNGLFQVEVLAGYLREFDPSVMDDTIITTWSCPPWRSHSRPYISRMQAGCCSYHRCIFAALSLLGHLFCLLMGIHCSGRRWNWSGGGGAQLGSWKQLVSQVCCWEAEGRFWGRKTQLSCRIKESRGRARKGHSVGPGEGGVNLDLESEPLNVGIG